MPKIHIQPVTPRTVEICADVIAEAFAPIAQRFGLTRERCPNDPAFIAPRHIKADYDAGAMMYLLYENAYPVGFAQIMEQDGVYELKKLGVRPDYSGQGYGVRLIRKAEGYVSEKGGGILRLGILEPDAGLRSWYEYLGYTVGDTIDLKLPYLMRVLEKTVPAYQELLVPVGEDDPIFRSAAYRSDVVAFSMIEKVRRSGGQLFSNGRSAVVASGSREFPTWVWTSDDLTYPEREACELQLRMLFEDTNTFRLVARQEFLEHIGEAEDILPGARVDMLAYSCREVILSDNGLPEGVTLRTAGAGDVALLAEFRAAFESDCYGHPAAPEEFMGFAEAAAADGSVTLLEENGKPVACAMLIPSDGDGLSKVSFVYTLPAHRRRGYATLLAADLTRRILAAGDTAVLYADTRNPASNKAYQRVGFRQAGLVCDQWFSVR